MAESGLLSVMRCLSDTIPSRISPALSLPRLLDTQRKSPVTREHAGEWGKATHAGHMEFGRIRDDLGSVSDKAPKSVA